MQKWSDSLPLESAVGPGELWAVVCCFWCLVETPFTTGPHDGQERIHHFTFTSFITPSSHLHRTSQTLRAGGWRGWRDGWMNGRERNCVVWWMDGWVDGWVDECVDEGLLDGWMNVWVGGMGEWMDDVYQWMMQSSLSVQFQEAESKMPVWQLTVLSLCLQLIVHHGQITQALCALLHLD